MSDKKKSDKNKEGRKEDNDSSDEGAGISGTSGISMDLIKKFFAEKLSFHEGNETEASKKVIEDLTFEGLIDHWKKGGIKNVITMVGAGVSTSAGIPDFRSPDTGLYNNLEKYDLPYPQAIFELNYFENNPKPFFVLAKELYPGTFKPTPSHYFIKLLNEKGLLVRHYTQNIDTLERIANIPEEKLVEAHGTFFTNHCLNEKCREKYDMQWAKKEIFKDTIPKCETCGNVVKPDIVFFGENLPDRFYELPNEDFKNCDLLIIMGTSLEVHPFASLVDKAGKKCLRLLINRDKVGQSGGFHWFLGGVNLAYDSSENTRDIAEIGDCDDVVYALADGLGWGDELKDMVKKEHERIDKDSADDNKQKENVKSTEET